MGKFKQHKQYQKQMDELAKKMTKEGEDQKKT